MNLKNLVLLIILFIFAAGFFGVWRKIEEGKKRLAGVEKEVAETIGRKEELQKEISQKQSLEFLEREARNRLNLIKPGERIVILPPKEARGSDASDPSLESTDGRVTATPNWQKWWKLFFD